MGSLQPDQPAGTMAPDDPARQRDAALLGLIASFHSGAAGRREAQEAWRALCERHHAVVYGILARMLASGNSALPMDLLLLTFEKVWFNAGKWRRDRGTVAGWICTIATHTALDELRPRRPIGSDQPPEEPSDEPGPEEDLQRKQDLLKLRHALAQLPAAQQLVLLLRAEGMTNEQVAAHLGASPGTTASRYRLGRERVAALFATWNRSPAAWRAARAAWLRVVEDERGTEDDP